ncbi:MAG TPA: hypothetical protein VN176_03340 [Verrucomicrobiae bacterium]|jgi:hypothetical protein|nr:hypothetical protein [Verrucomicrobiae bacterium]
MRRLRCCFLIFLLAANTCAVSQTRAAPTATGGAAAKICAEPYAVTQAADGWPEAPLTILFHRRDSKAAWTRNPAIKAPGLEATNPASARTVACVEESLEETGKYDNGLSAYQPSWSVILVRLADRKAYFSSTSFDGEKPPELMLARGENIGKRPVAVVVQWMRLIAEQKVARFKMRFWAKDSEPVSGMAFSADNSKLVMAQEARSTGSGTPPSPITVFDLSNGKILTTLSPSVFARHVDISKSGNLIAADGYKHVEIWDVATQKVVHRLEAPGVQSLSFGPDDTLAVAGEGQAALWNVANERKLRSASGSYMTLSPNGTWLVAKKDATGITVQELESGRTVGTFPSVGSRDIWAITSDGKALGRFSILSQASIYLTGEPRAHSLTMPSVGLGGIYDLAPTRDGFVIADSDGIIGIAAASSTAPQAFATDRIGIRAVAVSPDGKLIAVGDMGGNVSIWELR